MTIPSETRNLLGIGALTMGLLIGAVFLFSRPATPVSKDLLLPTAAYTKGNKEAKTTLVEFSDFQCPACKAYQPTVAQIVKENETSLAFTYRHFPLPQHTFGQAAAEVAEAAGKQGKFWEMHDLLFARQDDMSDTLWTDLAKELKLNEDQFAADRNSEELKAKIASDKADGTTLGVNSTPTFFLNGIKMPPMNPDEMKLKVTEAIGKP